MTVKSPVETIQSILKLVELRLHQGTAHSVCTTAARCIVYCIWIQWSLKETGIVARGTNSDRAFSRAVSFAFYILQSEYTSAMATSQKRCIHILSGVFKNIHVPRIYWPKIANECLYYLCNCVTLGKMRKSDDQCKQKGCICKQGGFNLTPTQTYLKLTRQSINWDLTFWSVSFV